MDEAHTFTLKVNGQEHHLRPDPRTTVPDALREQVGLTGTKKDATTVSAAPARSMSTASASHPASHSSRGSPDAG